MKSEIIIDKKIILNLSEKEANWLMSIMQNPLYGETPDKELEDQKEMRKIFWYSLNDILKNDIREV